MMVARNYSFVYCPLSVGLDGSVATMTETHWLSSVEELESRIRAIRNSGSLLVLDIEFNFDT